MVDRHTLYYTLLRALRESPSCPLCALELDAQRGYFHSLLAESVNDPGVRRKLRESHGLCPRHAHVLLAGQHQLEVAILYQDQLDLALGLLQGADGKHRRVGERVAENWEHHEMCPACANQVEARGVYVDALLASLGDEQIKAALDASHVLCIPHLVFALSRGEDDSARTLVRLETRQLQELRADLKEFIDRNDYRRIGEGFGEVAGSWREALEAMVGTPGVL